MFAVLSSVVSWKTAFLEDSPGMPVTCLLGVVDPCSFQMTEPYSSLTSASQWSGSSVEVASNAVF